MNNEENADHLKALLKQAISPVKDAELHRDLWPQMLGKLDEQAVPVKHVPWLDWTLAAILSAVLFLFPGAIPVLLYQL